MRLDPRLVATLGAVAALGVASLADWWTVSWTEGIAGAGSAGISGTAGTGGLAALLPGVVLATVLATLTLGRAGRRAVGVVALLTGVGMAAAGFAGPAPAAAVAEQHSSVPILGPDATVAATGLSVAYGVLGLLVAAGAVWWVARPPVRRARVVRGASGDVTDPVASWKAMDEGFDPTDEGERA